MISAPASSVMGIASFAAAKVTADVDTCTIALAVSVAAYPKSERAEMAVFVQVAQFITKTPVLFVIVNFFVVVENVTVYVEEPLTASIAALILAHSSLTV